MKKTTNSINIEGYVFDHSLQKRTVQNTNSVNYGVEFIMGDLNIAVDEEGLNVIPVHFTYVPANGKKVKTYNMLEAIIENPECTWVQGGKENALKLAISSQLSINDFFIKKEDGKEEAVAAKRIEGGFINEIAKSGNGQFSDAARRNVFTLDMLIRGVTYYEETVKDNGETYPAYAEVKGYAFDFRGSLLPITLRVDKEAAINFFMENNGMDEPNFRKIWGHIDSLTVTKEVTEESAFGEPMVRKVKTTRKAWVIDGAAMVPYAYGDPDILDDATMQKKVQERNIHLAEVKKNFEEWSASNGKNGAAKAAPKVNKGGFNVKKDTSSFTF